MDGRPEASAAAGVDRDQASGAIGRRSATEAGASSVLRPSWIPSVKALGTRICANLRVIWSGPMSDLDWRAQVCRLNG